MEEASALFMAASKLSQTLLRLSVRSSFSTVAQQKAPKAVIVPQKFLARRMREQYRIKKIRAHSVYQQKPRKLALNTYRDHQSGRPWFDFGFHKNFWPLFLIFLYEIFFDRFVKARGRSQVKY